MKRLRLALFTPVPSQRSGIADYSYDLLPFLREIADVSVVAAPTVTCDPTRAERDVISHDAFERNADAFDMPIYQIGNSVDHHGYMVPYVWRYPGVLVLHDCCLQHLVLGLTLQLGDSPRLRSMLQQAYGNYADNLMRKLLFGSIDPLQLSFAHPFIERSRGVLVHSEYARNFVREKFPAKPISVVPMGIPPEPPVSVEVDLRSKYGFDRDDFVVASVTTPAHNKRIDLVLEAVAHLLPKYPKLKLAILGSGPLGRRAHELLANSQLRQAVRVLGWLSAESYREYIRLADAAVDIRYPSGGETSASLLRALQAGKPLIVSLQGTFSELPDAACLKIPAAPGEFEKLVRAVADLIDDPARRAAMGKAAFEFAANSLSLEAAAAGYVRFTEQVLETPTEINGQPFPELIRSRLQRMAVATTYNMSRSIRFLRVYGWEDTWRRMRRSAHSDRSTIERQPRPAVHGQLRSSLSSDGTQAVPKPR